MTPSLRSQSVTARVTVRMRGTAARPSVLEAATVIARAFRAELLGLFVEDERLAALATMPFAREVSVAGARALSPDLVRREMDVAASAMKRRFEEIGRSTGMPARFVHIAGEQMSTLSHLMSDVGILALGEPLVLAATHDLDGILASAGNVAGVVVSGPNVRRTSGSVLAVFDSPETVETVARAATNVAAERGVAIEAVVVVSDDQARQHGLAAAARAHLPPATRILRLDRLSPSGLSALVERERHGLVVSALTGTVARDGVAATRLTCAIACPLLLMSQD